MRSRRRVSVAACGCLHAGFEGLDSPMNGSLLSIVRYCAVVLRCCRALHQNARKPGQESCPMCQCVKRASTIPARQTEVSGTSGIRRQCRQRNGGLSDAKPTSVTAQSPSVPVVAPFDQALGRGPSQVAGLVEGRCADVWGRAGTAVLRSGAPCDCPLALSAGSSFDAWDPGIRRPFPPRISSLSSARPRNRP